MFRKHLYPLDDSIYSSSTTGGTFFGLGEGLLTKMLMDNDYI
jgi:hypothetical protein